MQVRGRHVVAMCKTRSQTRGKGVTLEENAIAIVGSSALFGVLVSILSAACRKRYNRATCFAAAVVSVSRTKTVTVGDQWLLSRQILLRGKHTFRTFLSSVYSELAWNACSR